MKGSRMSESNGYATVESFAEHFNKRRYVDDVELPKIGKVTVGSLGGQAFLRYQAARERATAHAMNGERDKQLQALEEVYLILATNCLLTRDHNPLFNETHRPMLVALDGLVIAQIIDTCNTHALSDEESLADAQKK